MAAAALSRAARTAATPIQAERTGFRCGLLKRFMSSSGMNGFFIRQAYATDRRALSWQVTAHLLDNGVKAGP
jgi:hypothetical protein